MLRKAQLPFLPKRKRGDLKGYSERNLKRMRQGKAPQRYNKDTGRMESMELHHKIPRRKGGSNAKQNLQNVRSEEHAQIDRYRHVRR